MAVYIILDYLIIYYALCNTHTYKLYNIGIQLDGYKMDITYND